MDDFKKEFCNKIILVTGGTGTIGSELVRQLLKYEPKQLRVLSRDQNKQYNLAEETDHHPNLRLFIGDIRDRERLDLAFENVDIIFHAAALKHVPSCEYNPAEAVKTNIIGSQNVIDMARKHGVKKVIGISTDKAVNPNNIMGTSKLMMERLFINANQYITSIGTKFACVRFGNVAWASASVLPIWAKQIEKNGEITITDANMTRFIISTDQAVNLVLRAGLLMQGGEIFILKMPSIKLGNLAKIFTKKYAPDRKIKIRNIGNRGGEKKHEELIDISDLDRDIFDDKKMFIITPPQPVYFMHKEKRIYDGFKKISNPKLVSFSSKKPSKTEELIKFI